MTDLLFVDTNLLVYCLDPAVPEKRASASHLLRRGTELGVVVTSPQSLNECYRVLTHRRQLVPRETARAFVLALVPTCRAPLDLATIGLAWQIEEKTNYRWWDCLLLSAAILAGCSYFLSEDMTDGDDVEGLRILNPFTNNIRPLLS